MRPPANGGIVVAPVKEQGDVRERVVLPPEVDVSERACADLVARVASRLAPDLARSVGPVHWKHGDEAGVDWTAEGFVDGVLVVVCLRPGSREVSLLVEPRFTSPAEKLADLSLFYLFGALAAGITVGIMKHSIGWGFVSLIAAVVASICIDVGRNELHVRRTIANPDRDGWRRRFQEAVAAATNEAR